MTSRSFRLWSAIYALDADGGHVRRLTKTPYPNSDFVSGYSPDGKHIAFWSDRRYSDGCCSELFVMNADGSHAHAFRPAD